MWPRFTLSSPNGAACSAVAVVARTRTGRRWLEQHRDAVLAEASIPSFGDVPQGRPRPDVIVARLSWSPGILDRPDLAQRRFRLHRADTASPCLAP
jgi:hypothetical protein